MQKWIVPGLVILLMGVTPAPSMAIAGCPPDCPVQPAPSQPDTGLFNLQNSTGIYLNSTPYSNTLTNQYLGPLQNVIHLIQNSNQKAANTQVGIFNPSNYDVQHEAAKTELGSIVNTNFSDDNLTLLLQGLTLKMQELLRQNQKSQLNSRMENRNAQISELQKQLALLKLAAEKNQQAGMNTPSQQLALLSALLQQLGTAQKNQAGGTSLPPDNVLITMQQLMIQQQLMNQMPIRTAGLGQGIAQYPLSDMKANEAMNQALTEQLNAQLQNNQEFMQNTQQMIDMLEAMLKTMRQSQYEAIHNINRI